MLHRFTDQERTVVRNSYGRHAMMRVTERACHLFDSRLQNISLWPEELFVWAAVIMDDVKESGDQYMTRIGDLWKDHYRQLRAMDKSLPQDELKLTASIILYVPTLILQTSNDSVHRYMGKQMLNSVSLNYDQWAETYTQLTSVCQRMKPQIGKWVNDFMALDNEQYLSDEIEEMVEGVLKDEGLGLRGEGLKPETGNIYVTVEAGAEYIDKKIVERNVEKVESGGTGFVEQSKKK